MRLPHFFSALGVVLAMSTSAFAVDALEDRYISTDFDWQGFYAGVGLTGADVRNAPLQAVHGYLDVVAGYNFQAGDVVFGAEVNGGAYLINWLRTGYEIGAEARVGYLVDPSVLTYAAVGVKRYSAGALYGYLGAGIEVAATENISLDFEYKNYALSNNGWKGHAVSAEALWHF